MAVATLRAWIRARFRLWLDDRTPMTNHLTLTHRNVYILPTKAGLMLGATLLVLLVASINYQLNLGYLLTFLLAGCVLASMYIGHGTLRGVTLHLIAPDAIYKGEKSIMDVVLYAQSPRHAIGLAVGRQWVWTDVCGQAKVQLSWTPERRGLHCVPTLSAQTFFPLGTFRAWAVWRPAAQVLVYPLAESSPPPLDWGTHSEGRSVSHAPRLHGEQDGVRPYQRGDSLKTIVWKKAAKTGELVSRDSMALQAHTLWLDRQRTGLRDTEAQLSRLCAWVLQCEEMGLTYGLRLKSEEIAPSSGIAHQQRCLCALALAD